MARKKKKPAKRTKAKPKPKVRKSKPKPKAKPIPVPVKSSDYGARLERVAKYEATASKKHRDIGPIPPIADIGRRARCRDSLRLFGETYNPAAFSLPWCEDHFRAMARIEEAATLGALYAYAMPRGSGKSTIARMAALWAISYGLCRYVFLIGANAGKAEDTLRAIKTFIRFLPEYAADFPEIAFAAGKLGGIANRASGQLCQGKPTLIEWSQDRIVLPTVPPPENWPADWPLREDGMVPTAGAVLSASGLTGDGIRGSLLTLSTGESVRPDLVLLDDPQSSESAKSPSQNATREALVSADVLGMAGPGRGISAVMACTVISADDFIDRILDRKKHPLWRGERTRLLRSMPDNLDAWEQHFEIYRRCAQREPPDFAAANADYLAHRETLDAGAEAAWPARKLPGEISAVQHAMYLYCRDPRAFFAEYQNQPQLPGEAELRRLQPGDVLAKVNRLPPGLIPARCVHLTMGVDVQESLLYYSVVAWEENFTGYVVAYGSWPDQQRSYFTLADVRRTLALAAPGAGREGAIRAGLDALASNVLGREFHREDGTFLRIGKALVDSGFVPDVVHDFVRRSPHAAVLMPARGVGIGAKSRPMAEWQRKPGERMGWFWCAGRTTDRAGWVVRFDTNHWKGFLRDRWQTAIGDRGCLSLFGTMPDDHRMFSEHQCAEVPTRVTANGRTVDEWSLPPAKPDNHFLDTCSLCAVAAAQLGARLPDSGVPTGQARPRVSFRQMQAEARRRRGD